MEAEPVFACQFCKSKKHLRMFYITVPERENGLEDEGIEICGRCFKVLKYMRDEISPDLSAYRPERIRPDGKPINAIRAVNEALRVMALA